jgi:hypothetical protein
MKSLYSNLRFLPTARPNVGPNMLNLLAAQLCDRSLTRACQLPSYLGRFAGTADTCISFISIQRIESAFYLRIIHSGTVSAIRP